MSTAGKGNPSQQMGGDISGRVNRFKREDSNHLGQSARLHADPGTEPRELATDPEELLGPDLSPQSLPLSWSAAERDALMNILFYRLESQSLIPGRGEVAPATTKRTFRRESQGCMPSPQVLHQRDTPSETGNPQDRLLGRTRGRNIEERSERPSGMSASQSENSGLSPSHRQPQLNERGWNTGVWNAERIWQESQTSSPVSLGLGILQGNRGGPFTGDNVVPKGGPCSVRTRENGKFGVEGADGMIRVFGRRDLEGGSDGLDPELHDVGRPDLELDPELSDVD